MDKIQGKFRKREVNQIPSFPPGINSITGKQQVCNTNKHKDLKGAPMECSQDRNPALIELVH